MASSTFVKGAIVLAYTGVTVKLIGAVMRIILAALMGDEGIGLYQMAYPVYATLLTISTAGIPVAISKLVSEKLALEDPGGAYRVYQVALVILTASGLTISLLLAVGAGYFAENVAGNPQARLPILAISPAIFFVTIMSAMRGFFQGHQHMVPTAISQFVEQVARVVTSIGLVVVLLPVSLEYAAAGAAFGAVSGGAIGLLVLIIIYYRKKSEFSSIVYAQSVGKQQNNTRDVVNRVISLSIPITLASIMLPLINLLDLGIGVNRLLDLGLTTERATALYGQLTGMGMSLMQLPTALIIALTISLVPAVSEAFALDNDSLLRHRLNISTRLTVLFALPSATGLFLLSLPQLNNAVTVLLYNNAEAAYPLSILAWGVLFFSFHLTTTGTLQGMGYPILPVKNMAIGISVKALLTWFLTGIPEVNIGGAALATVACFAVVAVLNMWRVARLTGYRYRLGELFTKPIVSVLGMVVSVILVYRLTFFLAMDYLSFSLANALATVACVIVGAFVYLILLLLLGWLTEAELGSIPNVGEKLLKWARKYNLIKEQG